MRCFPLPIMRSSWQKRAGTELYLNSYNVLMNFEYCSNDRPTVAIQLTSGYI